MSKLLNASICLSDLLTYAKSGHSSVSKSQKNGKLYVDVNIWINDKKDKYNNDASISLNSKKDSREKEGRIYVGNGRFNEKGSSKELTTKDKEELNYVNDEF